MIDRDSVAHARSLLFVPGARPDRFARAASCGADVIILDLEDAVAADDKDTARGHVADHLSSDLRTVVRINAPGTPWHDDDLAMIERRSCAVMLPKAEDPEVVTELARRLPDTPMIPLVETAGGIMMARELCRAAGVVRVAFGNVDLAAGLGVDPTDHQALLTARSTLVLAASSAGIAPPIDGVTTGVDDGDALRADTRHAESLGFSGKLCIHPNQVPVVRSTFAPDRADERWAREVLAAAGDGSVTVLDGRMIDKPVVDRARSILRRADMP